MSTAVLPTVGPGGELCFSVEAAPHAVIASKVTSARGLNVTAPITMAQS